MLYVNRAKLGGLAISGAVLAILSAAGVSSGEAAVCSVSVDDMNFGSVDTLSGFSAEASAEIFVTCDQVSPDASLVTVCGNFGAGSGGASSGARHMISGSDRLDYQLYSDPGRNSPWGAYNAPELGSPLTIQLSASAGTASAIVPLYGGIFGNQMSAVTGSYLSSFHNNDVSFFYAEGDTLNCSAPTAGDLAQAGFTVQATVSANCLVETEDVNFGQHGIISAAITAVGEIRVTCTPGTDYSISLDGGLSGAADPEQREMQAGNKRVTYGLYADQNHTTPWGTGGGRIVPGTGAGDIQTMSVYGRVPPQNAVPGSYSDTVVVTITY